MSCRDEGPIIPLSSLINPLLNYQIVCLTPMYKSARHAWYYLRAEREKSSKNVSREEKMVVDRSPLW